MKCTNITSTSFTKLTLFSHKVSFVNKTLFPLVRETLYAGRIKLYAEASELWTHTVFQLVVFGKNASSECILQVSKKLAVGGC